MGAPAAGPRRRGGTRHRRRRGRRRTPRASAPHRTSGVSDRRGGGARPRDRAVATSATRLLTEDVQPAVRPEDREVVIDTSDGTITLPLDRYFLTEPEQAEVLHASALAMHECAADRGFVISDPVSMALLDPGIPPLSGATGGSACGGCPPRRGGATAPWGVSGNAYGVAVGTIVGAPRTADQREIISECGQTPTVQQFWPEAELSEHTPDFVKLAVESSAGRTALDEWDACLATHGLHRDEEAGRWDVTDGQRNSGSTPDQYGAPLAGQRRGRRPVQGRRRPGRQAHPDGRRPTGTVRRCPPVRTDRHPGRARRISAACTGLRGGA